MCDLNAKRRISLHVGTLEGSKRGTKATCKHFRVASIHCFPFALNELYIVPNLEQKMLRKTDSVWVGRFFTLITFLQTFFVPIAVFSGGIETIGGQLVFYQLQRFSMWQGEKEKACRTTKSVSWNHDRKLSEIDLLLKSKYTFSASKWKLYVTITGYYRYIWKKTSCY